MKAQKVIYVCHTSESRCTNKNSYHDILLYVYIRKCETFLTLMHIAGGSDDWAKGGAGIKYSYTVELPDTGRHGFLLPASKTLGSAKEALALTEAMITNMV